MAAWTCHVVQQQSPATTGEGRERDGGNVIYPPAAATIDTTVGTTYCTLPLPPRFTVAYFPGPGMYVEHPRTCGIASYTTTSSGQELYSSWPWL